MFRVVILGGGFGGMAAAHALRALLPSEDEIVLIEQRASFSMGLRKTWALTRQSPLADGQRSYDRLASRRIRWVQGAIDRIVPDGMEAVVDGASLAADAMVIALGAQHDSSSIPGLAEHAHNVYSTADLDRAAEAIANFPGGRVAVGVFGTPYPCPPAPFEIALLLADLFEARRVEAEIEVFSPMPMSLPILGQVGCALIEERLEGRQIRFLPSHKATSVEPGRVRFATGPRSYDLILSIPPHRLPSPLANSGLADGQAWIRPDPTTMELGVPNVYAIGDCTEVSLANGMALPKAGVFAESEAGVVARRIASRREGGMPDAKLSGQGFCFLEVGGGKAQLVQGDFLAHPGPQVQLTEPSAEVLEAKRVFERDRLAAWFGE
ncbi:MAG: FAD-dependent oxidoreductase [Anaerolineales bacterium]